MTTDYPVTKDQSEKAREAIRTLCSLFGGPEKVNAIHLVVGDLIEAQVLDGNGNTKTVTAAFVCRG